MARPSTRSSRQRVADTRPEQAATDPPTHHTFLLPKKLVAAAEDAAETYGRPLPALLRIGLDVYISDTVPGTSEASLVPRALVQATKPVVAMEREEIENAFLKTLRDLGWPEATIAAAMVASGAVEDMPTQEVARRIRKAPSSLPVQFPHLPEPLRQRESSPQEDTIPVTVTSTPKQFEFAHQRAISEGVTLGVVVENALHQIATRSLFDPYIPFHEERRASFELPKSLVDAVQAEAEKRHVTVSEVLRYILEVYVAGTPKEIQGSSTYARDALLPPELLTGVLSAFITEIRRIKNAYLKALWELGWKQEDIALAIVASGAAETMSRQGVYYRIRQAPSTPPEGMPIPPAPRYQRRLPLPTRSSKTAKVFVRVSEELFRSAERRATYERAPMTTVIEDMLAMFVAGALVLPRELPADT